MSQCRINCSRQTHAKNRTYWILEFFNKSKMGIIGTIFPKILAASTASARPLVMPSTKCCKLPTPPLAITGTATSTYTTVTITDATANGPNPGLMVLSGTCGGTFTPLGCSQSTITNGNNESVSFSTVVGQVYFIVICATNAGITGPPSQATDGSICVTEST